MNGKTRWLQDPLRVPIDPVTISLAAIDAMVSPDTLFRRRRRHASSVPNADVMTNWLRRAVTLEAGQDLVEYALLAGFVSLVAVATSSAVGQGVTVVYEGIDSQLQAVPGTRDSGTADEAFTSAWGRRGGVTPTADESDLERPE